MFIKRYGTGPAVCFCIHGWSGDRRSFEPLVEWLREDATLYSVDLPGYGLSVVPRAWTLGTIATDLCDAIADLGEAPVTVVGNCIGALLALRVASLRPALVSRLVLIDPLAWWPWYFRIFTAPGWGKYAYSTTFANPLGRWLANAGLRSKRTAGTHLTKGFASVRHNVNLHYLHMMREIESAQEFAGLELPIDVVFGSRTFGAVRKSSAVWQRMWPQARVRELEGIGHLPLREAPREVSEIVLEGGACRAASQLISAPTLR